MLTADGKTLECCRRGQIQLGINGTEPVYVETLVMDTRMLGFNLIFGIDAIRAVGDVIITSAGVVSFAGK